MIRGCRYLCHSARRLIWSSELSQHHQIRNLRGNPRSKAYQQPINDNDKLQIARQVFTRAVYVPHHPHQVEGIQIRTSNPMN